MPRIDDILCRGLKASREGTALICRGGTFTYEQLDRRVDQLAGALCSKGVSKGDVVSLVSENAPIFLELTLACSRIGAVCAVLSTRFSSVVLSSLLKKAHPRLVFASQKMASAVDAALKISQVETECLLGEGSCFESLLAASSESLPAEVDVSDPALILYTSGTTGVPKGVVLSHGALLARIEIDRETMRMDESTRMLFVLPFFHVTCVSTFVVLACGGVVTIASGTKDFAIVADIQKTKATHVGLLPYHLRLLAGYLEQSGEKLSTLKLIAYGGEPVNPCVINRCRSLISCLFWQGYGMTETASSIAVVTPEDHERGSDGVSVGRAIPSVQIRVCSADGSELPAESLGEVWVKTPTLMTGYLDAPELTAQVIRDGWYLTGDIGRVDAEGRLTLVDRKEEMFISGGENVYPSEIAACIRSFEGVQDVVVTRVSDDRWGESAVAFVELADDVRLSRQEISDRCASMLGHYKRPKAVVIVESLQRKASGKVSKEYVQSLLARLGEGD